MKRLLLLFSLSFLLLNAMTSFAYANIAQDPTNSFQPCVKTYVLPEQLGMTSDGIFIKFDDQWFQTEGLHSDAEGIFIKNLRRSECGEKHYVPCRNCGRCVHEVYDICPYCNKPV